MDVHPYLCRRLRGFDCAVPPLCPAESVAHPARAASLIVHLRLLVHQALYGLIPFLAWRIVAVSSSGCVDCYSPVRGSANTGGSGARRALLGCRLRHPLRLPRRGVRPQSKTLQRAGETWCAAGAARRAGLSRDHGGAATGPVLGGATVSGSDLLGRCGGGRCPSRLRALARAAE